jgi:hypothetical protein
VLAEDQAIFGFQPDIAEDGILDADLVDHDGIGGA